MARASSSGATMRPSVRGGSSRVVGVAVQAGGPGVWKEKLVRRLELKNAA